MPDGLAGVDLTGGDAADTLPGTRRDDTLDGGRGDDLLLGRAGSDRLTGGPEGPFYVLSDRGPVVDDFPDHDLLRGGRGDDVLAGGWGDDLLLGGPGADSLEGGWGSDTLLGGGGNDTLLGGRFGMPWVPPDRNLLLGGGGEDWLQGFGGDDTLLGGPGDDTLLGNGGDDVLAGGAGQDRFLLGLQTPGLPGTWLDRGDVILDFEAGLDRLDLSRLRNGSDLAFEFLGEAPFTDSGRPEVRVADAEDGATLVEVNFLFLGQLTGSADRPGGIVRLEGWHLLSAGDFIL